MRTKNRSASNATTTSSSPPRKRRKRLKHVGNLGFDTEDEAAFAYNVTAVVLEGPNPELNQGMNLTLERKKEIEREVLEAIRLDLELPSRSCLGPYPQLYDPDCKPGFWVEVNNETREAIVRDAQGRMVRDGQGRVVRDSAQETALAE